MLKLFFFLPVSSTRLLDSRAMNVPAITQTNSNAAVLARQPFSLLVSTLLPKQIIVLFLAYLGDSPVVKPR